MTLVAAYMAHIRQSGPYSGLGFHVKVHKTFSPFPFSAGGMVQGSPGVGRVTLVAANMAHIRQAGPDSGLGAQVKVLKTSTALRFRQGPSGFGQGDAESQDRILVPIVLLCSKSLAGVLVQGPPGVGKATLVAANMAHVRQSRPCSGLGFQVKVQTTFQRVPFFGRGQGAGSTMGNSGPDFGPDCLILFQIARRGPGAEPCGG